MNHFDDEDITQGELIYIDEKSIFDESYNLGYGTDFVKLNQDHLKALLEGKVISFGIQCGEYGACIILDTRKPPQPKETDNPQDNPWCEACKEDLLC